MNNCNFLIHKWKQLSSLLVVAIFFCGTKVSARKILWGSEYLQVNTTKIEPYKGSLVYTNPTVSITRSNEKVCPGGDVEIALTLEGTAPWTVVYNDGVSDYTLSDIMSSNYSFTIFNVSKATTYTIKKVSDKNASNEVNSTVIVELYSPITIIEQPQIDETASYHCSGETVSLSVRATGEIESYQWYKDGQAVSGANSNVISVNNFEKKYFGEYIVEIKGKCGEVVTSSKVKVVYTLYPGNIIVQKWNNTLVANNNSATNGGYKFIAYKWFKNNRTISIGEKSYYSAGQLETDLLDMRGDYFLELTTTSGEVLKTCAYRPIMTKSGKKFKIYPNPVVKNRELHIETDLDENSLKYAIIEVYNSLGSLISTHKVKGRLTTISPPGITGVYIVKFRSNGVVKDAKVIVD